MRRKAHNQSKFMRFITIPVRVLSKARDFYVRSLTDYSERLSYGNSMVLPSGQISALPKSFSVSSSSSRSNDREDYRELIRAASVRRLGHRNEVDMFMQQQMRQSTMVGSKGLPKSCSVGMGRIDEETPCDFGEVGTVNGVRADLLYPRSRSYAVTKRSVVF